MNKLTFRYFLNSTVCLARSKPLVFSDLKAIKLREPIVPTHKNFDLSPDHPLWAFFPDGNKSESSFRELGELDTGSRAWTFPELRRKSFDDLHKLWYIILKERNILAREVRLAESMSYAYTQAHSEIDDKLKMSQKRIKQVLLERQVAYERVQLFNQEQKEYLRDFEARYVNADASEIELMNEKLIRLQYAMFGIQPQLMDYDLDEDINEKFVEGISYVANTKIKRYISKHPDLDLTLPLNGIMEELPFLVRDVDVAIEEVKSLRETGNSIKLDKIDVFPFLKEALKTVIDEYHHSEEGLS